MPFKSEAQRRKFHALLAEGKMDQKTIDEWEKDTPEKLPERLAGAAAKGLSKKEMIKKAKAEGEARAFAEFGFGEV